MGEAVRKLDMIDVAPAFGQADADRLNARFAGVDTAAMLDELLTGELKGRIALVSSFGAESAVLLHLVANFRCCQDQAIVTVDRALDPAGPGKRIFRTQKYRLDIQKPLCDFLL